MRNAALSYNAYSLTRIHTVNNRIGRTMTTTKNSWKTHKEKNDMSEQNELHKHETFLLAESGTWSRFFARH